MEFLSFLDRIGRTARERNLNDHPRLFSLTNSFTTLFLRELWSAIREGSDRSNSNIRVFTAIADDPDYAAIKGCLEAIRTGADWNSTEVQSIVYNIDLVIQNRYREETSLEDLVGRTLKGIYRLTENQDAIVFVTNGGDHFAMYHEQDCGESVTLEDVVGDLDDLVGSPLTMAEVVSTRDDDTKKDQHDPSHTWSFYKFATVKGYVTLRWYGTSTGHYSEEVDVRRMSPAEVDTFQREQKHRPRTSVS